MRINRQKRVNKYLNFYANVFGFKKPYRILLDGTICHIALKSRVNLQEQLPQYLGGDAKILTTQCAILETEKIGSSVYGAMLILKQFPVHQCGHKTPISASSCFKSMLGRKNKNRYMIGSQDRELQAHVRMVPATPLIFIYNKAPTLEPPSPLTEFTAKKVTNKSCDLSESQRKALKEFKSAVLGQTEPNTGRKFVKRKKIKGGPNPLSCKKKKNELLNKKPKKKKKNKNHENPSSGTS